MRKKWLPQVTYAQDKRYWPHHKIPERPHYTQLLARGAAPPRTTQYRKGATYTRHRRTLKRWRDFVAPRGRTGCVTIS